MIADEKKEEEKEHQDEFDQSMKRFEEEMKGWRKEFSQKIKQYQWQISYEYKGIKGTFKGRGENRKPEKLDVLSNSQYKVEAEWKNG